MNKINSSYHELQPAYGRDYKSAKEAKESFLSGKDFIGDLQLGFKPVSATDFAKGTTQLLRYGRLTKVTTVKIP